MIGKKTHTLGHNTHVTDDEKSLSESFRTVFVIGLILAGLRLMIEPIVQGYLLASLGVIAIGVTITALVLRARKKTSA